MDVSSVLGRNTFRRTGRHTRRKRLSGGTEVVKKSLAQNVELPKEPKALQQRVFLYIQLNEMTNLPNTEYPLELHLYHPKNTLQKMQERYTTETIIYQREFNLKKPVFAMGVMQDDIEDMNTFSDQPLLISLYQRIPRRRKGGSRKGKSKTQLISPSQEASQSTEASEFGENVNKKRLSLKGSDQVDEEWGEEGEGGTFLEGRLELLSRGHCDLLQLFQRRRFISDITIYLYPEYKSNSQARTTEKITTHSVWHMYSILPILKNFNFTNLAFLTLESIYNVPDDLHSLSADLGLSVAFRSKEPEGEDGTFKVIPLCTYSGFISQIISDQNTSIVWESIKRDLNPEMIYSFNQMETNSRVKLPKLFRMLLWESDVDFQIEKIDPVTNLALINNSMHRFVLNEEMRKILEQAVVHNDYELVLQLYQETPGNVLYEGAINPSIFGYPNVNYCRFATRLSPVLEPSTKLSIPRESLETGPMFCTFKVCFFQPICERNKPLDEYNENVLKRGRLRRCFNMDFLKEEEEDEDVLLELYRAFDDLITDTIGFIIKRDVQDISDRKDFFCCQLGNLSNLVLKICGCDFNIRMPTKTNLEFREMLTHMYKELMDRIEGIFTACSWKNNCDCSTLMEHGEHGLTRLMNEMRLLSNSGQRDLAIQMYEEIDHNTENRIIFDFVTLLNSVETLQFEQAARYFMKPQTSDWSGHYFTLLIQLYVNYMVDLRSPDEEIADTAKSNMIESLRRFAAENSLESEIWILLYCFYKEVSYLPGMEFTRWKFQNLLDITPKQLGFTPCSLYELYLPVDFDMKDSSTSMNNQFFPVFKLFTRLGAYAFAEVVFADIEQCFTNAEVYLIKTTLKILQRQIDAKFKIINMPTDNSVPGRLRRSYQLHINGSVEYSRGRCDEALKYFWDLFLVTDPDDKALFKLSFVRLGQLAFDRGQYELAEKAYDICLPSSRRRKNFIANYGKGLSLYHQNRLEEAIPFLSRCTEINIFMPDVWGYLATINLRLNRNKTALECWKMARMNPELSLDKNVYAELDKIRYSDVHLLVDDDGNPAEKMSKMDFIPL
ncbi:LOW QUALITY PROTEIN: uncharacterized protein LOC108104018 [Drosophila eugracilis]|uniref:LOW QUALITY PROTEIN: uncharacterized protein LOC108104018 n=1 Tax=Drosophila eugracilis TaxID=29029 RepID=UPI001BD937BC|nr:LOW QUALITY PROTEIN: uncharacterized protein LOC108104018 [Drosophila eugracilis]